jgi:hypothetical protein
VDKADVRVLWCRRLALVQSTFGHYCGIVILAALEDVGGLAQDNGVSDSLV